MVSGMNNKYNFLEDLNLDSYLKIIINIEQNKYCTDLYSEEDYFGVPAVGGF